MMNWISCKDKLPVLNKPIIAHYETCHAYGDIKISYLEDTNEYERSVAKKKEKYPIHLQWVSQVCGAECEAPTHWLPLPTIPPQVDINKEKDKNEI